jgi:hypothetical protein
MIYLCDSVDFSELNKQNVVVDITVGINFWKRMMKSLVTKIEQVDSVTELCKEINVLDAVHWIR